MANRLLAAAAAFLAASSSIAALQADNVALHANVDAMSTAKQAGFISTSEGLLRGLSSGAQQAQNRTAYITAAMAGATIFVPANYTMDWKWASTTQLLGCNEFRMIGCGDTSRILVSGQTYFDNAYANLVLDSLYFDGGSTPLSVGQIVGIDNIIADVDFVSVKNCKFRNVFCPLRSSTGNTNIHRIKKWDVYDNRVFCQNGLARIMQHKFGHATYANNYIDCGALGGIQPAYSCITHGYIVNNGSGFTPADIGTVTRFNNNGAHVKPWDNPNSPGNYGFCNNCEQVLSFGDRIRKVYPFYGSRRFTATATIGSNVLTGVADTSDLAIGNKIEVADFGTGWGSATTITGFTSNTITMSNTSSVGGVQTVVGKGITYTEALFTGDGTTATFTGTLARAMMTPDGCKILAGGVQVADDADHGWAPGDGAFPLTSDARQFLQDTAGNTIGWLDYQTGKWSITPATVVASGVAWTINYFIGGPIDNVEPTYQKSSGQSLFGMKVLDCQCRQGGIGLKGGGELGYLIQNTWENGPGSQYGATVDGCTVKNRISGGIFSQSRAVWGQQDFIVITNCHFEGLADRILRMNLTGLGRQSLFRNNLIKDFSGASVVTLPGAFTGFEFDFNIDGLLSATPCNILDMTATSSNDLKQIRVRSLMVSERITAAKFYAAKINSDTTCSPDVVIERVDSLSPWTAFLKFGAGSTGRLRLAHSCLDNIVAIYELNTGATAITATKPANTSDLSTLNWT